MSIITDFFPVHDFCGYLTGDVGIFPFDTPPEGFLETDGTQLLIADYPALFNMIGVTYGGDGITTFNLPDYRGFFLRNMDDGTDRDPDKLIRTGGNYIGSTQDDVTGLHTHGIGRNRPGGGGVFGGLDDGENAFNGIYSFFYHGSPGDETRPENINVLYCIKY